jgi:serine/threonine protein kinase
MNGNQSKKTQPLARGSNGAIHLLENGSLVKESLSVNKHNINNFKRERNFTKTVYNTLKSEGKNIFVPEILSNVERRRNNTGKVVMAFYKLRRVPGVTLNEFAQDPTTTDNDIMKVKEQCREHVRELKKMGIVHGDLHTGNIMVDKSPNGSIKVYFIDFGRARRTTNTLYINNTEQHKQMYTKLGCSKQFNWRICPFRFGRKVNEQGKPVGRKTTVNNNASINAIFPSNSNPIVSYNRRAKNLEKTLINTIKTLNPALFPLLEKYYPPSHEKRPFLNEKMRAYSSSTPAKINNKKIHTFLKEMELLNRLKLTIPTKTPTKSLNRNFGPGGY